MIPVSELFADLNALDGTPLDRALVEGRTVLVVNVASKCGLTPAVRGPRAPPGALRRRAASPCSASPATSSAGRSRGRRRRSPTFCSMTYGVSFPLTEKIEVNGTPGTRSTSG